MSKSLEEEVIGEIFEDIKDIVNTEVDDTFKEEFVNVAYDKGYNTYSDFYPRMFPKVYKRRYTNKGLLDETKMFTSVVNETSEAIDVEFYSEAKTNPYRNAKPKYSSLESEENLVDFLAESWGERSVDLMEETEKELDKDNSLEEAIIKGLKRKGY